MKTGDNRRGSIYGINCMDAGGRAPKVGTSRRRRELLPRACESQKKKLLANVSLIMAIVVPPVIPTNRIQ